MNDGDVYLVIADEVYYEVAKRNMKGIVPLYYEMGKAKAQDINGDNLYTSLINGYKFGNVGLYSNKITVMENEPVVDLNSVKLLTCLNNFFIDAAKTGVMYEPSKEINKRLKVSNGKLPYFFMFAKEKDISQVKPINNSTVNRICKKIEGVPHEKFEFKQHGTFRYNHLYKNKNIEINDELIKYYLQLDKEKNQIARFTKDDKKKGGIATTIDIKEKMVYKANILNISYPDMVDMVVKYIYEKHKNLKKTLLWDIFGEDIINNINVNIRMSFARGYIMCKSCGKRVKNTNNKRVNCEKCAKRIDNLNRKNRKR